MKKAEKSMIGKVVYRKKDKLSGIVYDVNSYENLLQIKWDGLRISWTNINSVIL